MTAAAVEAIGRPVEAPSAYTTRSGVRTLSNADGLVVAFRVGGRWTGLRGEPLTGAEALARVGMVIR